VCVSGLRYPEAGPDHTRRLCLFALEAIRACGEVPIDVDRPELGNVQIRAGISTGPVVASVVGLLTQKYCLFGEHMGERKRCRQSL
jgi:class 3 adenylate cyclase